MAVTGLSGVFWTGDSCDGSSASAGVSEVDLRGGMLVAGPVARVRIFDCQLRCNREDELVMRVVWRWSACQERGKKKVAETRREWEIGDSRCGGLAAALIVGRYGRILFGLSICLDLACLFFNFIIICLYNKNCFRCESKDGFKRGVFNEHDHKTRQEWLRLLIQYAFLGAYLEIVDLALFSCSKDGLHQEIDKTRAQFNVYYKILKLHASIVQSTLCISCLS